MAAPTALQSLPWHLPQRDGPAKVIRSNSRFECTGLGAHRQPRCGSRHDGDCGIAGRHCWRQFGKSQRRQSLQSLPWQLPQRDCRCLGSSHSATVAALAAPTARQSLPWQLPQRDCRCHGSSHSATVAALAAPTARKLCQRRPLTPPLRTHFETRIRTHKPRLSLLNTQAIALRILSRYARVARARSVSCPSSAPPTSSTVSLP